MTNDEIELGFDYNNIKEAIEDKVEFLEDKDLNKAAPEPILRETELVSLALQELQIVPKSYREKVEVYIEENTQGELTTARLESLVLDFDETLKSYKQVTNLRSVSGHAVLRFLESDQFKQLSEELTEAELLPA